MANEQPTYDCCLGMAKAYSIIGKRSISKHHYRILKQQLEETLDADPSPCNFCRLGECLYEMKKYEAAIQYLSRAMEASAGYPLCPRNCCHEAAFLLARIYQQKGKNEKAVDYYKQAMAISPDREYREAAGHFGL